MKKSKPVSVRAGQVEFLKVNTEKWDSREVYQWLLSLSWPQFTLFIAVEIYSELEEGRITVDYGRLHDTEPTRARPT